MKRKEKKRNETKEGMSLFQALSSFGSKILSLSLCIFFNITTKLFLSKKKVTENKISKLYFSLSLSLSLPLNAQKSDKTHKTHLSFSFFLLGMEDNFKKNKKINFFFFFFFISCDLVSRERWRERGTKGTYKKIQSPTNYSVMTCEAGGGN